MTTVYRQILAHRRHLHLVAVPLRRLERQLRRHQVLVVNQRDLVQHRSQHYNLRRITMLETLFWIAVGAFVGWNLPQPDFAKSIQAKILGLLKGK